MRGTTSRKELQALERKVQYWQKKATKLNWFGLETPTCQSKKTSPADGKVFERGTLVTPPKTNSARGTGRAKRGDRRMTVSEVLAKLEKHEAECTLRYKAVEERLENHKSSLKALDMKLWALAVLIMVAPFVQKFLG